MHGARVGFGGVVVGVEQHSLEWAYWEAGSLPTHHHFSAKLGCGRRDLILFFRWYTCDGKTWLHKSNREMPCRVLP